MTVDSDKLVSWFVQTTPIENRPFKTSWSVLFYFSNAVPTLSGCRLYPSLSESTVIFASSFVNINLRHTLYLWLTKFSRVFCNKLNAVNCCDCCTDILCKKLLRLVSYNCNALKIEHCFLSFWFWLEYNSSLIVGVQTAL